MNKRHLLPLMLVIALICLPMASMPSEGDTGKTIDNVVCSHFDDVQNVSAGDSCNSSLSFYNDNPGSVLVIVSQPTGSSVKVTKGLGEYPLEGGASDVTTLTFTPDYNAKIQKYTVEIQIKVCDAESGKDYVGTTTFTFNVTSSNSNESYYNKILGIFENPFPSPFNEPWATALINLCVWAIIAIIAVIIIEAIIRFGMKDLPEKMNRLVKQLRLPVFASVMLLGIVNSLRICGTDSSVFSIVKMLAQLIYIPLFAYIIWKVYKALVWRSLNDLEKKSGNEYIYEAMSPLLHTIGKIVLAVGSVAAVLATFGLSLAVVITGAGIAGLALSFGSKDALNEFFYGLMVLTTRPFKKGDIIKVEGSDEEMKVVNIGILRTEFKNRSNVDHFVVPNSTLASSMITNYTRTTVKHRLFVYVDIHVDDDIDMAKKILYDIAYADPDVITDGSVSKPHVRVNEVENGMVTFRLAIYIDEFLKKDYIYGRIRENIIAKFRENNIPIPIHRIGIIAAENEKEEEKEE